jgi:hypothetical protein
MLKYCLILTKNILTKPANTRNNASGMTLLQIAPPHKSYSKETLFS